MFNRLMMKRSIVEHKKSYCNILLIFIISFSFLCFTQVFSDSMNNYWRAVAVPNIEKDFTCDIQIKNISEEDAAIFEDIPNVWTSYENGHLVGYVVISADKEGYPYFSKTLKVKFPI